MSDRKRAILSVYDKTGLVELGQGLAAAGFELVASGGTAKTLADAGLDVVRVSDATGSPEILGGRVKTLHPKVHGGILARSIPEHEAELERVGIALVGVVACNLYPFAETARRGGASELEIIEEIDIGGVTLLRAAAKNHEGVVVLSDPADYEAFLTDLRAGQINAGFRRRLALKAFRHTAAYDAAIATWLATKEDGEAEIPSGIFIAAERIQTLRYGENPHQRAALYRAPGTPAPFRQLQGKEISYNNLLDTDAALAMPAEFETPAVAIVKHNSPCGLATADTLVQAFQRALACDPVSAFGSVIACNREVDEALMDAVGKLFVEVLIAPAFTAGAHEWLAKKKKNCRVLIDERNGAGDLLIRSIAGGLLAQTRDTRGVDPSTWNVVTERQPSEQEKGDLAFGWLAVKHVRSNAIVFAKNRATVGIGAGQTNRIDSVRIASFRAGDEAKGAIVASDAFFPFADGIEAAAEAGITAAIEPGGSIRDEEVIAAANRLGMAMVFTGERHFRH